MRGSHGQRAPCQHAARLVCRCLSHGACACVMAAQLRLHLRLGEAQVQAAFPRPSAVQVQHHVLCTCALLSLCTEVPKWAWNGGRGPGAEAEESALFAERHSEPASDRRAAQSGKNPASSGGQLQAARPTRSSKRIATAQHTKVSAFSHPAHAQQALGGHAPVGHAFTQQHGAVSVTESWDARAQMAAQSSYLHHPGKAHAVASGPGTWAPSKCHVAAASEYSHSGSLRASTWASVDGEGQSLNPQAAALCCKPSLCMPLLPVASLGAPTGLVMCDTRAYWAAVGKML